MENTALERWKKLQTDRHHYTEKLENHFPKKKSLWYDAWVHENDYVQKTLPYLEPYLNAQARILEIGPGTGAFTIPFARAAREVVAVEPDSNMQELLKKNLSQMDLKNVEIIGLTIEKALDTLTTSFDLIFASHSLYHIFDIDLLLKGLLDRASNSIILIGTGDKLEWHENLDKKYRRADHVSFPDFSTFYNVLLEMNIIADVRVFSTSYNYVFNSQADLIDFWQDYFHLDDSYRSSLLSDLQSIIKYRDNKVGIYSIRNSALVMINKERNIQMGKRAKS